MPSFLSFIRSFDRKSHWGLALVLSLVVDPCSGWTAEPSADTENGKVSYQHDVAPILKAHCYECHGENLRESNYRLDIKSVALAAADFGEPSIVPKDSRHSLIIGYVAGTDEDGIMMPPEDEGEPLTPDQVEILKRWIDQGADWPEQFAGESADTITTDHWSYQPIVRPEIPSTASEWSDNPIDRFVEAQQLNRDLKPSPEADPRTLIRRLFFGMTGLPPTYQQVTDFAANPSETAYRRMVEEVLASPRYGERWAQHWLDVVRFAETDGFEVNTLRPNAWHYRDYVIDAFNNDKPYDRFVYEQLAGDTVGQEKALGFLVAAPDLLPGQIGKDKDSMLEARQDELDEMITATSASFLGLTIGCARCHNHKFDPILQKDYYALQAFFSGTVHGERTIRGSISNEKKKQIIELDQKIQKERRELTEFSIGPAVNPRKNVERFEPVLAKFVRFTILATNLYNPCIDELEIYSVPEDESSKNVALRSAGATVASSGNAFPELEIHQLDNINDGKYGNGHSWISSQLRGGWVQIEFPEPTVVNQIVWGRDRESVYADRLATDYRIEVSENAESWKVIASSATRKLADQKNAMTAEDVVLEPAKVLRADQILQEIFRLEDERAEKIADQPSYQVYAGVFREPEKTFRLIRGDHKQPKERLTADIPTVFGTLEQSLDSPEQSRREALAKWIIDPSNPLTPRVIVNRIWHQHFGTGIVDSPSDFGVMGSRPTHPKLLDWLASELIDSGWSIKHIQRLIINSRTFRQASNTDDQVAVGRDAQARYLWRFPARRMEAEAIRDSILSVAGTLNLKMGGAGFQLFEPRVGLDLYKPKKVFGEQEWRRLIYAHKVRMETDGVFSAFDVPDGGQLCAKRSRSTTAIQALNLFNSPFVFQQAGLLAQRVQKENNDAVKNQISKAFQLILQRVPDVDEAKLCSQFVNQFGLQSLCRLLLNTNEFVTLL